MKTLLDHVSYEAALLSGPGLYNNSIKFFRAHTARSKEPASARAGSVDQGIHRLHSERLGLMVWRRSAPRRSIFCLDLWRRRPRISALKLVALAGAFCRREGIAPENYQQNTREPAFIGTPSAKGGCRGLLQDIPGARHHQRIRGTALPGAGRFARPECGVKTG